MDIASGFSGLNDSTDFYDPDQLDDANQKNNTKRSSNQGFGIYEPSTDTNESVKAPSPLLSLSLTVSQKERHSFTHSVTHTQALVMCRIVSACVPQNRTRRIVEQVSGLISLLSSAEKNSVPPSFISHNFPG